MEAYIFGKRNMIHIINIRETLKGLLRAKRYLTKVVADGQDVLFVGTKRQARGVIEEHAARCGMHYVTERWLGGILTNFRTIRSRLSRLEELEKLEETGVIDQYSKKMVSALNRERRKIERNLGGIRNMTRMPGAMVAVDVKREYNALKEASKLGIPTICLIDTDGDPDLVDIPIPGNDDALRAVDVMIREMADSILEAKAGRKDQGADDSTTSPRRPVRASASAAPEQPSGTSAMPHQAQAPQAQAAPVSSPEQSASESDVTTG